MTEETRAVIAEALPPLIAGVLLPEDFDTIRQRLAHLPKVPRRRMIRRQDLVGAAGVFLLVVLSGVPLILPFFFIADPLPALVSNGIAILMLFVGGYFYAKVHPHISDGG